MTGTEGPSAAAPTARPQATVPGKPLSGALPQVIAPAPPAGSLPRRAPGGHLAAGTLVDQKYVIERVLGEGGMGVVYLARDVHTGLHVVLKAVRQELAHRPDVRARTLAEGRSLAQIDHPNVVHLNAVVAERDGLWLVMQYIDGESLEQKISRYAEERRPMPLHEALSIFRQITAGIAAAHREGVIHRDLKPANVLVRSKDAVAKVTDFGIAKAEADALAGRGLTKGIIGSLYYMSPEQVTGRRDLDKRVDIYALGLVLYEMLVGQVPFDAESDHEIMRLQVHAPLPKVSAVRRDVPPGLDAFLSRACAKERAERFASCEEMLAALDAVVGPQVTAISALPPPLGGSSRPPPAATTVDEGRDAATPLHRGSAPASGPARPGGERRARGPWRAIGAVTLAAAGGAAALVGARELTGRRGGSGDGAPIEPRPGLVSSASASSAGASGASSASASSSASGASASADEPERSQLVALKGVWIGNGRELEAVLAGEALEFRVRDPQQFAPQDYVAGEARFSLREVPGEAGVFAVEDRIRFIAPGERTFDPARSRGTCQDVRTTAGGRPLRASFDGTRLSVEFAKIEPTTRNFVVERGKVVSCVGLGALPATRVVSTLSRP